MNLTPNQINTILTILEQLAELDGRPTPAAPDDTSSLIARACDGLTFLVSQKEAYNTVIPLLIQLAPGMANAEPKHYLKAGLDYIRTAKSMITRFEREQERHLSDLRAIMVELDGTLRGISAMFRMVAFAATHRQKAETAAAGERWLAEIQESLARDIAQLGRYHHPSAGDILSALRSKVGPSARESERYQLEREIEQLREENERLRAGVKAAATSGPETDDESLF